MTNPDDREHQAAEPGGLAQLTIGAVLADFVARGWADQITAPAGPGSSTRAGEQADHA